MLARGIPSRARCGFGTSFRDGCGVDHWITEYWDADQRHWVRVDTEHLGKTERGEAAGAAPSRGTTLAGRRYSARICQSWLDPPVEGHWMTRAPSAVEASLTSAHQPLRTLTSWW